MLILDFFHAARFESQSTLNGVGMEPQGSLWGCGWRWLVSSLLAVRVGQLLCVDVAGQCVGEGARPSRVRFDLHPPASYLVKGAACQKPTTDRWGLTSALGGK